MEPFVEEPTEVRTLTLEPKMIVIDRPPMTGNACSECGGMMCRTGSCETCTECGTTGGCG